MDLSTVLGVALAWLFVGTAIYLGADGKAAALIDPTSFLVVLGGCIAATMAAFPFSDLKRLPKVLMKTVFWKSVDVQEVIDQVVMARRSESASPPLNPAATMASRITCS